MKIIALFLVLPVLILAKIHIDIIASNKKPRQSLHISGSNEDIISDEEIKTFHLTEEELKNAVKIYLGVTPDNVFLKSPTPWGDLYSIYNWTQVTSILKPLKAKILSVEYQPTVVFSQLFNNTSAKIASFVVEMKHSVENTVSSVWEKSGQLSAQQDIVYDFDIKPMPISGKSKFSYTSKWGENVQKSQKVTVGSVTGVEIPLAPHQSMITDLYATRAYMKVQVDYVAKLTGTVAVNFITLYKDHHFWSADVNKVLEAAGSDKSVLSSELINLGIYLDSKLDLRDTDTNSWLYSLPMAVF